MDGHEEIEPEENRKRAVYFMDQSFDNEFARHGVAGLEPFSERQRALKRSFDICCAVAAFAVLAIPMVAIAILIKLDSPGPILFHQARIGRGNRAFTTFKFRTMRLGGQPQSIDEPDSFDASERTTKFGRFLRASSADELPQLFNVLRGEMSIVGPRPHSPDSTAGGQLFWDIDERYWLRHLVYPGMTGLAQINGYLGDTVETSDLIGRLKYDLEYLEGWSLWRDIRIIIATVGIVFRGQGSARARRNRV